MLDGEMHIDSAPGQGTLISIQLPVSNGQPKKTEEAGTHAGT
jgi:hypothetical protein